MRKELYNNRGILISVVDRPDTPEEAERKNAAKPVDFSKVDDATVLRAMAAKIGLTVGDIEKIK